MNAVKIVQTKRKVFTLFLDFALNYRTALGVCVVSDHIDHIAAGSWMAALRSGLSAASFMTTAGPSRGTQPTSNVSISRSWEQGVLLPLPAGENPRSVSVSSTAAVPAHEGVAPYWV